MIRSFNGKSPRIAPSAFVSEAAYIVGDVEIGEYSSVWPGAVVRGDFGSIKIGNNAAIEDNCVIHSGSTSAPGNMVEVTIGDNAHIGHGAVINCRKISNNVLIGMNATVLHDAEIGDYSIIAAGCLVGEGMIVPDRSLVAGVPGKIKKEVSDKQLWWVNQAPLLYIDMARRYKEEGL